MVQFDCDGRIVSPDDIEGGSHHIKNSSKKTKSIFFFRFKTNYDVTNSFLLNSSLSALEHTMFQQSKKKDGKITCY